MLEGARGRPPRPRAALPGAASPSCWRGVLASALGIAHALAGGPRPSASTSGSWPSIGLTAGCGLLAALALRDTRLGRDGRPPAAGRGRAPSPFTFLLVLPGFERGDVVLTAVLVIDLVALAAGRGRRRRPRAPRRQGLALIGAGRDGLRRRRRRRRRGRGPAASFPTPDPAAVGARAPAASPGPPRATAPLPPGATTSRRASRGLYAQVLLPLVAIVGYPAIVGLPRARPAGDWLGPVAFFGPLFLARPPIAFARQGVLLVEQRRAAMRERLLGAEAMRRNRELEALTGLASTMTEVLEERPVMSRGLEAIAVAARTSAAALHLLGAGGLELTATTGDWERECAVAPIPLEVPTGPVLDRREGRYVARMPVIARGRALGLLTLVRAEPDGPFQDDFTLLGLLVDQLAVALQNARDHHEKLEAAIRDPLTGLYNRRFFYEGFGQEIARHDRYGGGAALALFDIDDFRRSTTTLGPQAGDEVLEEVGRIVSQLVRPSDTFARIGGEEFGLLMPETGQLDALLVAERLRTAVSRHQILGDRAVTLSGGVAALPQDGTTREELQRRADQALYWAKRNGKNMCAVASEAIADDAETVQHGHARPPARRGRRHRRRAPPHARPLRERRLLRRRDRPGPRPRRRPHRQACAAPPSCTTSARSPSRTRSSASPAGLTDEEFEAIKVHPQVGRDHARTTPACTTRRAGSAPTTSASTATATRTACAASEIPLEARIIFVADSFEAMTSDRPVPRAACRSPTPWWSCAAAPGTQFDPRVVEVLAGLVERGRLAVLALRDSAPRRRLARFLPCGFQQPSMKRAISLVSRSGAIRSSRIELGLQQPAVGQLVDEHARSR